MTTADSRPDVRDHWLATVQVGRPCTLNAADGRRRWTSAIHKVSVSGRRWLSATGLEGDEQADRSAHGGPDKAVCVYPGAHYAHWTATLPGAEALPPGSFGENFTVVGATEEEVCIGDVYTIGEAVVQVAQPRSPCWKLARRWGIKDLALQVQQTGFTGWYLRVVEAGLVEPGQPLKRVAREWPRWTVAAANHVRYEGHKDLGTTAELASVPVLSASWREALTRRMRTGSA